MTTNSSGFLIHIQLTNKDQISKALSKLVSRIILVIACLWVLFPIFWIVSAALSARASLFTSSFIPTHVSLLHFKRLFATTDFLLWLKNSAFVCIGGSLLALAFTTPMAYAFSRFRFWGRRYGLLILVLLQILPATATIVAIYRIVQFIGLINNPFGLVLVYGGTTIPFNAWLLRGYFESIPHDIEESAYIDGASRWTAFIKVAFPLALPMIAVVFIFNLITFYNDYLLASIILSGKQNYTVALGMRFFDQPYATNWGMFSAASILACLPITLFFYSAQRYLVANLVSGAIRG